MAREVTENFVMLHMPACGIYVPHIHNLRVHGRFYGIDLKKEMVVLDEAGLVNHEENLQIRNPNRRTLDTHVTCMVNSCPEKINRVFCDYTSLIFQYALALDVIQVRDSRYYFQSC